MHTQQRNRLERRGAARFWKGVAQITLSRDRTFIVSHCLYEMFRKGSNSRTRLRRRHVERRFPLGFAHSRSFASNRTVRPKPIPKRCSTPPFSAPGRTRRHHVRAKIACSVRQHPAHAANRLTSWKPLFFRPWMHSNAALELRGRTSARTRCRDIAVNVLSSIKRKSGARDQRIR
jgi:hypothetical protein